MAESSKASEVHPIIKLSDAANLTSIGIEKRALKQYKGNYYLYAQEHIIVEPPTGTIFPVRSKYEASRLVFSAVDNSKLISDLNKIKSLFHQAIKAYNPEKIILQDYKEESTPVNIGFTLVKSMAISLVDEKGNYMIVDHSKINQVLPVGSKVRIIVIPAAIYDIEKKDLKIYFQTTVVQIIEQGKFMPNDARALMSLTK